ncbi:alpha-amylase family glycosyl hydrolase [Candidatus Neomarinimicrobiota bacterium]
MKFTRFYQHSQLFAILLAVGACNQSPTTAFHPIPVLTVEQGHNNGFDLSVYRKSGGASIVISTSDWYIINQPDQGDSIYITPTPTAPPLGGLAFTSAGETYQLLVRNRRTVKHTFTYPASTHNELVVVMGGFNDWSRSALPLVDEDGDGILERTVYMRPLRHEYKFVVDGLELIDPTNPVFMSNNIGGYNSILDLTAHAEQPAGILLKEHSAPGRLTFRLITQNNVTGLKELFILWDNTPLDTTCYRYSEGLLSVNTSHLGTGRLRILGLDEFDRIVDENVTLLENDTPLNPNVNGDDWHFSVLYSLMVDRFLDGDPANTSKSDDPDVHPLANFHGGDFKGIIDKLEEDYFQDTGISAIWLSPVNSQPAEAYRESIPPNRKYTGYHGYWPVAPRSIDPRYGTAAELHELVGLAHSRGIKVILDFVSNHVHEEHPYFKDHSDWFGSMELPDGTLNIRNWSDETRLTTWFDTFLPSFDYPNAPTAEKQATADARWWLETFDLDGFRQDAVKHVPHTFWKRLTNQVNAARPGKFTYQIGETFGSDDLIGSYVNPGELSAQFNFSIYFPVRYLFAQDIADFSSVPEILRNNARSFGPVHLMGNITSSHDQVRFMALADGQLRFDENGTERAFADPPAVEPASTTYGKLANFTAFNMLLPGVPVVYYGEEIGMLGAGDPDNRRSMEFGAALSLDQQQILSAVKKLVHLRGQFPALALGDLLVLKADGPLLVIAKHYFDQTIIAAFNNGPATIDMAVGDDNIKTLLSGGALPLSGGEIVPQLNPYSHQIWLVGQSSAGEE